MPILNNSKISWVRSSSFPSKKEITLPTISDPGFRLARDASAENIALQVLPGPSAVTMAVALSGLPTDRFSFDGFPPRTSGARQKFYESLRFDERTLVFFEAPHRLEESLVDAITRVISPSTSFF